MNRTALVTGASSGIGLAVARTLRDAGYRVIGTSRNPATIPAEARIDGIEYLALDLNDTTSIIECAIAAGPIDVLVNNAGESQSGPLEDLPTDAIQRVFQLNVFGPIQLTQILLPGMRERGYGRVVMVGSMLGSFPLAYRSSYSASKAALRTFASAARHELSPYGVWLTTVEPGSINTGISQRRVRYVAEGSPYAEECAQVIAILDQREAEGIDAQQVAETVLTAIQSNAPRALYARGSKAPLVFALKRFAPQGALEKFMCRTFGLHR